MKKSKLKLGCAILTGLFSTLASGESKPVKLQLCHDELENYPWTLKDKPGLAVKFVEIVGKKLGVTVEAIPLPWKRCLSDLENMKVDGAINSSFKADRAKIGAYPMRDATTPDATRAMHTNSYTLYRLKGSPVGWDGKQFSHLTRKVGVPLGFSIADEVLKAGASIAEVPGSEEVFGSLLAGRTDAAALQTSAGRKLLQNQKYKDAIEPMNPPLSEKAYYLMLSFAFLQQSPNFAQEIWRMVGVVRESEEFRKIETDFETANPK